MQQRVTISSGVHMQLYLLLNPQEYKKLGIASRGWNQLQQKKFNSEEIKGNKAQSLPSEATYNDGKLTQYFVQYGSESKVRSWGKIGWNMKKYSEVRAGGQLKGRSQEIKIFGKQKTNGLKSRHWEEINPEIEPSTAWDHFDSLGSLTMSSILLQHHILHYPTNISKVFQGENKTYSHLCHYIQLQSILSPK